MSTRGPQVKYATFVTEDFHTELQEVAARGIGSERRCRRRGWEGHRRCGEDIRGADGA